MRILAYVVILVLLFFAPLERLDVAKLEPVQTVAISMVDGQVVIQTDTKNKGQAENIQAAIDDLEKNTPGVIYLDTAEYLLVTEEVFSYTNAIEPYLRPTVKVCLWDGRGQVEEAAKFLGIRNDLPSIRQWNTDKGCPVEKS